MSAESKSQSYMAQLERLLREATPPPGKIVIAQVDHAEDCAFLRDPSQPCECNPHVTLAWVGRGAA